MTAFYGKRDRKIIPRWRAASRVIVLPEGKPLSARLSEFKWSDGILQKLGSEWNESRRAFVGCELVGAAYTLKAWDFGPAKDAAKFLCDNRELVPHTAFRLAKDFLTAHREGTSPQLDPSSLERRAVYERI